MANMSYCMFRNTLEDLRQCAENLRDPVSEAEAKARKQLIELCRNIAEETYEEEFEQDEDVDCGG